MLAHRRAAAHDDAHVDHGAFADHGADIDDGAHHDDCAVADRDLVADHRARLDAGVDVLEVKKGNGRIAAVVFNDHVVDLLLVRFKDGTENLPVAEDHLVACAEDLGRAVVDWSLFADRDLHGRLLFCRGDVVNDFLGVHHLGKLPVGIELRKSLSLYGGL